MLYNYSVLPLFEDHFEERVASIVNDVKTGAITTPLFIMSLVPEGDPVVDKLKPLEKSYIRYRDALLDEGIECAILVQSSLGHGYKLTPAPFRRIVNLNTGATFDAYCPEDEGFIEYMKDIGSRLAALKPKAIMLDDDFRLAYRPGGGCACPYHIAEFNHRAGTDMTREALYRNLSEGGFKNPFGRIFAEVERDSLVKLAEAFRSAIDEIDPSIQGINCTSGFYCEAVQYTNKVFAGKGNPTIVRLPNGIYAPESVRRISDLFLRTAVCKARLKRAGIDLLLSETDTIPFNRYAKSARYLHSQYSMCLLEGLSGAKHWLTRTSSYEPSSGVEYRRILAKHRGLYEKLSEIGTAGIDWVGVCSSFTEMETPYWNMPCYSLEQSVGRWVVKNIEAMGLPFYFAEGAAPAAFLDGCQVHLMTDEQIEEIFRGSVFLDGDCAKALYDRGFGHYLGVEVVDWDLDYPSAEAYDDEATLRSSVQKNPKHLKVIADGVEVLSNNIKLIGSLKTILSPAVTKFKRSDGRITVVYCGSPNASFVYTEGFSFLNETRKAQFVSLLTEAGALPVYAVGDDEICMRAGYLPCGSLFAALLLLGLDPMECVRLKCDREPSKIFRYNEDGSESAVAFRMDGETVVIEEKLEPMYPLFLRIEE